MSADRSTRDPFPGDEELQTNRISSIESEDERAERDGRRGPRRPLNPFIPIGILAVLALTLTGALVYYIKFYQKPSLVTPTDKQSQTFDAIDKSKNLASTNIHIQRGKESYAKGYLTDAIAEFNEVIESDASDDDKAIALTYLGMIADERGDHGKAIEYLDRAKKYNKLNPDIYKNLALAYRHKKDFAKAVEYAERAVEMNDKDTGSLILLGNIYFEQSRYDDAIKQYRRALDLEPENGAVLYNLASALLRKGDEVAAVEYLKRAGAADKIGEIAYKAYTQLGALFTDRKAFDEAEKYLKLAVTIRPGDALGHYNLGIAYLRQNQKEKALEELKKAVELGETNPALMENLGEAFFSLKDYDRSLEVYNKLKATSGRNVKILARIGEIYYEKGELDNALASFRRITEIEPATENARVAYLNMGNILDDAHRYDEAIESYQKALAISPKDDTTLYNLGIAYKHANKPELAIEAWRKAADLNHDDPKPLAAVADFYYDRGFYDLAEKEYQRLLARWPNLPEGHFKIATIYYKKGQYDYAAKAYARVIEIDEKGDLARKSYINRAVIMTRTKTDEETLAKGVRLIQKALMLKPDDPDALFALGIIYSKKQMYDRAIDTFYQVVKGSRENKLLAEAYNNIGKAYYQKKDYKKAMQAFTRGIEEDPANEEIRMNRKVASQAFEADLER